MVALEPLAQRVVHRGGRGREERDALPLDRLDRLEPERGRDHRDVLHRADRLAQARDLLRRDERLLAAGEDDEVGDADPVRAEVAGDDLGILRAAGDEHPRARRRSAAAPRRCLRR